MRNTKGTFSFKEVENGTWNHVKREYYLEEQQKQSNWGYKDNSWLQETILGGFSWRDIWENASENLCMQVHNFAHALLQRNDFFSLPNKENL